MSSKPAGTPSRAGPHGGTRRLSEQTGLMYFRRRRRDRRVAAIHQTGRVRSGRRTDPGGYLTSVYKEQTIQYLARDGSVRFLDPSTSK